MRRMNSVCFVQSCRTLWDTAFLLMVYLMFPQEGSEALYCNFVQSAGSQVEVKVFSLLFFQLPFYYYFFLPSCLCECANLFLSQHLYLTHTHWLLCLLPSGWGHRRKFQIRSGVDVHQRRPLCGPRAERQPLQRWQAERSGQDRRERKETWKG